MRLRSFTIYDIYKRNATLFKNQIAIQSENEKVTYGELFDRVNRVAGWLTGKGVRKGDRIAILAKNDPQFFPLMGGIAAKGAIMVPINFRLSAEEIGYNLTNTQPVMIVVDPDFEKMISDLRSICPSLKEFVTFGPASGIYLPFDSLLKSQPGNPVELDGDDPFIIMHTAAVQGKPRGAVISHHNLVFCTIQNIALMGLTHEDSYLNILPLFHIAGIFGSLVMMHLGGRNVMISKFDPKGAGKMIDQEKITLIGEFPPILLQLLDEQAKGEFTLSSLKNVLGIDMQETIKRFESLGHGQFWLVYGQTETMGLTSVCSNREKAGCAGKAGPLVDIKIVDEFDHEVEAGKVGEILVRGPLVFLGYWGEEDLSKHTFRDQWHHTGDSGRMDEGGYLWFAGRKAEKELIKPGGENVYPVEVEKVILENPGIQEVSVIGVPDPKFGEGIKAVCVLKPKAKLSEQELIDFVAGKIARYKKPGYVTFVESLPKRQDGSIDRAKVKEMYGVNPKS
ncbi:MAG TPA: AMP-binding protein [Thermodesulfobacteriota bacterium]|jgi:long-chain acyl-CoA synthetase|nr:AMP-binding protein [Thermodesulfobacteriota bacterium]